MNHYLIMFCARHKLYFGQSKIMYLSPNEETVLSHGICKECAEKFDHECDQETEGMFI